MSPEELFKKSEYAEILPEAGFARYIDHTGIKYDISDCMKTFGGSFVKSLSDCVITADAINLLKLVREFREYFNNYLPHKWKGHYDATRNNNRS